MGSDATSRNDFGPLESEAMAAIWRADEPVAVRDVVEALNEGRAEPLAYTTVMTVMSRLAGKKVLSRRKAGRGGNGHLHWPHRGTLNWPYPALVVGVRR